jgi:hypothetical protein
MFKISSNQIKLSKVTIADIILTVQELQNDKAKLAMWLTSVDDERQVAELIMRRKTNV